MGNITFYSYHDYAQINVETLELLMDYYKNTGRILVGTIVYMHEAFHNEAKDFALNHLTMDQIIEATCTQRNGEINKYKAQKTQELKNIYGDDARCLVNKINQCFPTQYADDLAEAAQKLDCHFPRAKASLHSTILDDTDSGHAGLMPYTVSGKMIQELYDVYQKGMNALQILQEEYKNFKVEENSEEKNYIQGLHYEEEDNRIKETVAKAIAESSLFDDYNLMISNVVCSEYIYGYDTYEDYVLYINCPEINEMDREDRNDLREKLEDYLRDFDECETHFRIILI